MTGAPLGFRGWESPAQDDKLVCPVLKAADGGRGIGRPNVVPGLQVRRRRRPSHGDARFAECGEIAAVGDAIAVVVAHRELIARSAVLASARISEEKTEGTREFRVATSRNAGFIRQAIEADKADLWFSRKGAPIVDI